MNDAEYAKAPHQNFHRMASLVVLGALLYLEITGRIPGGSTRILAWQVVATGIIWFCDDYFRDSVTGRIITYRTAGWIGLLGPPLAIWLSLVFHRMIFP